MRVMLKFTIPVERGNATAEDGSMQRAIDAVVAHVKPEAAYFFVEDGRRAGLLFFKPADGAAIMHVNETLFKSLDAAVTVTPALTLDELHRGFA